MTAKNTVPSLKSGTFASNDADALVLAGPLPFRVPDLPAVLREAVESHLAADPGLGRGQTAVLACEDAPGGRLVLAPTGDLSHWTEDVRRYVDAVLRAGGFPVAIPQVGDPLPAVATPTTADPLGVDPLCTRAVPCPFHDLDLATVVGNGRPTVLLVATPGFCQTDICGPVVDLMIDAGETRDDLDLIHCEVYVDPSEFASGGFPDLVPAVEALALPFEPSLFVPDAAGIIVARLDTTFDRRELTDVLSLV